MVNGLLLANWLSGSSAESFNLQLFLLIGSGLLAVALLVLSLTKWGQARPVWKCVVLSVAAHILLMGYAYGTHLIFKAPKLVEQPEAVRINLIEDAGEMVVDNSEAEIEEHQVWGEFTNDQLLPDVEQLERPDVDSEVVIERTMEKPDTEMAKPNLGDFNPLEIPSESMEVSSSFEPRIEESESVVDAEEIVINRRAIAAQPDDFVPQMELDRDFGSQLDRPEMDVSNSLVETNDFEALDIPEPFAGELNDDEATMPLVNEAASLPKPALEEMRIPDRHEIAPVTQMKVISAAHRVGDGQPLPDLYKLRAAENRLMVTQRRGGSIETEQSVRSALKWLANHQEDDGRWNPRVTGGGQERKVFGHDRNGAGSNADTGITALAVMALMANGNTHLEGEYQLNVQKGLEFLLRNQTVDGNLCGEAKLFARTYCHGMALLALSEALALTGDSRLTVPVQKGVDFSVYGQNKNDGGWRYQPGDPGDMSQFGWQVLAMHSAKAGGIYVPAETLQKMKSFLHSCSSGVGGGLASYRPNQNVSTTMTAEALVCRYFLLDEVREDTQQQASTRVLRELPSEHHVNLYYWYYGTMAMYQTGGESWDKWNEALKRSLLTTQVMTGPQAGSWDPNGLWAGYGGRVYSTAMAALCLEVYYRYLPMYEVAEAEDARKTAPERNAGRIIRLR